MLPRYPFSLSLLSLFVALPLHALTFVLPSDRIPETKRFYLALDARPNVGSTVPVDDDATGKIFLAFQADVLLMFEDNAVERFRVYRNHRWKDGNVRRLHVTRDVSGLKIRFEPRLGEDRVRSAQWIALDKAGRPKLDGRPHQAFGNAAYLPRYYTVGEAGELEPRGRFGAPEDRPRIYQMLPRLFGNENQTRKVNGTLRENGTGKFGDLSAEVLARFEADGFTHIWLTGVLQQATSTDYPEAGQRADDPDLLKGIAGSPYAIKDYFDVSPDYADDPDRRLEEFKALTERMHAAGLKVVIDFVPNHVARSYESDIRPGLSFGESDRTNVFFHPDNNFFYLTPEVAEGGPPLRLPAVDPETGEVLSESARLAGGADGLFAPERTHGRVTGNNVVSWRPSMGDWYETVKLNYGFDFLHRDREPEYPSAITPDKPIPDTWEKMDAIVAYWQEMGVDGFRADMAHMVPPEFWKWMIHRAKDRDPDVFFFAEAYNDDPAKVPSRDPAIGAETNVMVALLDAGFHAVYDDPGYDALEHLYTRGAWANDLQGVEQGLGPIFFDNAVRYAENHDEIRLAHPGTWGGIGMEVGKPVTGTLWGLSRGPVMLYHGQEVGEPGLGREGFGGDDRRTTIFDYWSMPELSKWWNEGALDGGELSPAQRALREWYVRLLHLQAEPAFTMGGTVFLNHANRDNRLYGKVEDVGPAGHWFFSYLRSTPDAGSHYLVTTNFHPQATLRHVRVRLPGEAVATLGLEARRDAWLVYRERLNEGAGTPRAMPVSEVLREGIYFERFDPLHVGYWELRISEEKPAGAAPGPVFEPGEAFLGAPPLTRLRAGATASLDLRRFGNPGADGFFEVGDADGVSAEIDRLNHVLRATAAPDAAGLAALPLRIAFAGGREPIESVLPLAVEALPATRIVLEDHADAESVALVGSFNDWKAQADPLRREGGLWVIERALPAGRHLYKFVIDGNWVPDPGNPEREADGYGGFNSVLVVGDAAALAEPWSAFVHSATEDLIEIFVSEAPAEVIAHGLPQAGGAVELPAALDGRRLSVDASALAPGTLVRVLYERSGGAIPLPSIAYAGTPRGDIWRDDIIYYAFTDRFYDGDPANSDPILDPDVLPPANYRGGDFAGIREKLENGYFDELGVNVLWLAPLNENPDDAWQEYLPPYREYTGYHGYWPTERYGVEERFGGEDELHELIGAAHAGGMKVLADLVLKHVHIANPVREERPELFGQLELADGTRNLRRWNDNPFTTWFEPFLPAFDFRNPEAIRFLLEDSVYWAETYRLDGYRLDAVKHIRPDFWWRFRTRMRDRFPNEDFYFVGETFQSREGISAFVGPNMLDGQFDFPLYDVLVPCFAQGHVGFGMLEDALRQSEEVYGRSVRMSPLLGNHDKSRFMAYADGDLPDPEIDDAGEVGWARDIQVDDPAAYEKLKLAMTFLMSINGVPMIYYGDEIGMTGAGDPDNRRMMRFGGEVRPAEAAVKDHFATLAKARTAHPSLYLGSRRALLAEADQYAYLRAHGQDRALVVFNRSDEPVWFSLDVAPELRSGTLRDLLSSATVRVRDGAVRFQMPPMSSALLVPKR